MWSERGLNPRSHVKKVCILSIAPPTATNAHHLEFAVYLSLALMSYTFITFAEITLCLSDNLKTEPLKIKKLNNKCIIIFYTFIEIVVVHFVFTIFSHMSCISALLIALNEIVMKMNNACATIQSRINA